MFVATGPTGGWLFLATTLLLLLLVTRPERPVEWLGSAALLALLAYSLRTPATVLEQPVRIAAVIFALAMAAAARLRLQSLTSRLLSSAAVAGAATTAWLAIRGPSFEQLRAAAIAETWRAYQALIPGLPAEPLDRAAIAAMGNAAETSATAFWSANVQMVGELYPATLVITALVGGWLAWMWYRGISAHPLGDPPAPLNMFRFNDQLVWLLVGSLGVRLFDVSEATTLFASNLLMVLGALYWLRGLAVTRYALARLPAPSGFKLAVGLLLVLPLAIGGWLLIGVTDTWLDIRRRLQPPQGVTP